MTSEKLFGLNKNQLYLIGIMLVILLGTFLRLHQIDKESIRLDEAQSIWQASHSLQYISEYMAQNVHLPLHNSLLHLWIRVFGSSEVAVRMMSAIPGILSLPAIYLLGREIFNDRRKSFVLLMVSALSPFWIWYSREIRMYTLLTLVSTLSYYLFLRVLRDSRPANVILYILVNLVGIYTHYFFTLVLLVQAVYFLSAWKFKLVPEIKRSAAQVFSKLAVSAVVLIIAFAPWVVYYLSMNTGADLAPSLERPSSFNIILSYFEFALGYQPENITASAIAMWPFGALVGFIFLSKRKNPLTPNIYLAILGAFLPIIIVYAVSTFYRPIYLTRYLITATPLFYVLITWLITEMKGYTQKVFYGVFFGALMLSLYNQRVSDEVPPKENYREAVRYVNEETNSRDIVVVSPPYTLFPVQYYYQSPTKLTTMPIWDKSELNLPQVTPERLKDDSTLIQEGHRRIFLIATLDLTGGYSVQEYLDLSYTRLERRQFSKFIWVSVYQAEYPAEESPDNP
jgi:mannosyltransferase